LRSLARPSRSSGRELWARGVGLMKSLVLDVLDDRICGALLSAIALLCVADAILLSL